MERRLGSQYVLDSVLGRGASGEVWRGRGDDGTPLAFKLLHQGMVEDPSLVRRFVEERALLLGLQHPNLVRIHDFVVEGPSFAIVMDLNEGPDLRKVIASGTTLPPAEVCRIGVAIAAGLGAVHAAGIVHRDIKPENVLLDATVAPARPRVTDFGIAQITDQAPTTSSSSVVGTAQYIAPEIYDGHQPRPTVDLYALGIVLYELSCGVTPFADSSALTVMRRHVEHAPGRPDGLPSQLWDIIAWCLAKNPADRPRSAEQLGAALGSAEGALAGLPPAPRRTSPPPSIPLHDDRVATAKSERSPTRSPAVPPRGRKKILIAAALAALLVAGIGIAAMVLTSDPDSPAADEAAADAPQNGDGDSVEAGEDATEDDDAATTQTTASTTAATTTSAPLMPDVVGDTLTSARSQFPSGTTVTVIEEAAPAGTPNGVVLAQDPPADADIPSEVTLTVATSQASLFLVDLEPVAGSLDEYTSVVINGEPQLNSVGTETGACYSADNVQYNLGRNYAVFSTVAGIDDAASDDSIRVTVEVLGDQRPLGEVTVALGEPQPIELDVTGVLRLELRWTPIESDGCGDNFLVFADAKITARPGYEPPQPTG